MSEEANPLRNERIVARLKEILADAEAGNIRSLMAVGVGVDGHTINLLTRTSHSDRVLLLGETVCLQQRLIDEIRAVNGGDI